VSVPLAHEERLYREYLSFFEHAEKTRRWSIEDDVPWEQAAASPRDPGLAACAESFAGVELSLPDYVASGMNLVRDRFGQAWFLANWAYEESKHSLLLREYLLRTGQRTAEQNHAYARRILATRWELPFTTVRQMTLHGALQEMTTFASYKKLEEAAERRKDALLVQVCRLIARDEMAHAGFYIKVCGLLLEEDGPGTRADLAHVFRHFRMPTTHIVPDWDRHVEVMREAGLDRASFFGEVWLPLLRRLGVDRRDLPRAAEPRAGAPAEPQGSG
jgi:acyl-[acyl-carrier-protein] desaturase